MATVGCQAAPCAAHSAAQGKLAAALARVATLEAELADCRAVRGEAAAQAVRIAALPLGSQQVPDDVLVQELATRLALAVPVLMDMLADRRAAAVGAAVPRAAPAAPPPCGGSSGTQCGTLGADVSDELTSSLIVDGVVDLGKDAMLVVAVVLLFLSFALQVQRFHTAACLPNARRGRSLPAGTSFVLAELVRRAGHPTAAPLASGPLWWHAGVEGLDDSALARPESSGGFGEHPAPRPSEGGAVHPHRLLDPGGACSTACTSSPAAFADPSIVTEYLLANESAVLSGGSERAAGDIDGEFSMQEVGSRNQDGDRSLASDAVAHDGFDLSPHLGTDDGVEAARPQRNGGRSLDDDALITSPPSGSCSCSGGGGIDEEDGVGGVGDGCTLHGSETVARQEPARGPKRLLALRRHVFAGCVALTVDRDIR
ncbi:unnamed protein product, partial [Prorocentrum cordatum]